ncbi:MAG: FAD-binding oxidoreductase [Gammaproteobacteria bacterium]|nr:FAD-binding oxidoreductase [Gammaproteobacteria bacterium]
MEKSRRSFWTWGYVADEPSEVQRQAAAKAAYERTGIAVEPPPIPAIADIKLRKPRLAVPSFLSQFVTSEKVDRITHTYGGHSLELLRAIRGTFDEPPDAVAYPETESQLEQVLEWCVSNDFTTIPYGGGTSVVWGLNVPQDATRAVSIDLERMNQILEVDEVSRAANFQAGILGPSLEAQLKARGLTLRHYPQSFPWSTVGGWVATRSGGHYATNHTHIDDFVESIRMLSPAGWYESRRLPGSGAGPSPDRMVIGSEGTLGIISSVWLRLQKRPVFRASAGVLFDDWMRGTEAVRAIVQTKLYPANLRILDPVEARNAAGVRGNQALLIIGFESADLPQRLQIEQAVAVARVHGGVVHDDDVVVDDGTGQATGRGGSVGAWRNAFIGVNAGVQLGLGVLSDTFETAITWDRWPTFDATIRHEVGKALQEALGDAAALSCRFTHVYPDGPAPYYSFSGPVALGQEQEAWQHIKDIANQTVVAAGGTITHHHAVGRMHKEAWEQQRPELFGAMLRSLKQSLDPRNNLNPGVLIDSC